MKVHLKFLIRLILIAFKVFPNILRLKYKNPTMKTALFKTALFVTEIYNSIYVCYLSSVSYTHTMHEFAFDKI